MACVILPEPEAAWAWVFRTTVLVLGYVLGPQLHSTLTSSHDTRFPFL